MHMNRLSNKVAVVIGGNSGIGQAIARRFAFGRRGRLCDRTEGFGDPSID